MFKQITSLHGDEMYLIVSLWIFIVFFVAVGFMLFFMKKEHIQHMKGLPFDEAERENDCLPEEQKEVMNLFLLAADTTANVTPAVSSWMSGSGNIYTDILIITFVIVMVTLLIFAVVIQKALRSILQITMPEAMKAEEQKLLEARVKRKEKLQGIWKGILGLRPLEEEKDIVIDHQYDGISELDNPVPLWFNALFYTTITFGFCYFFIYHVFGWGMNQDQEYVHEVAQAEKAKQEYLSKAANLVDESSVEFNEALAPAGKAIFMSNCVACHGNSGEGGIGPNLTDRHWLHGGEVNDIFKTVKYGVPEKGMVPWEQTLTPGQIAEVSSYIVTLRDTKPANPKAPEGVEITGYQSEGTTGGEEAGKTDSLKVE